MTNTEGAFCLSVDAMMTERDHNYSGWSRVRFFVPVKLKSVLAKYGELKSFRLLKEDEEKCNQVRFTFEDVVTCARHSDSDAAIFHFISLPCIFASDPLKHLPAFRGRILRYSCGRVGMGESEWTSGGQHETPAHPT